MAFVPKIHSIFAVALTNIGFGPKGFDPGPILRRATAKMLWIFGTNDVVIPTNASIAELERIIEKDNSNHEIHIIEGANHNFADITTGEPSPTDLIVSSWLIKHNLIR